MHVWVTRAQPAAEGTAARLRALGHEPAVAPVLMVRRLPGARLDLSGAGALAFTSPNAVAAFAALSSRRELPVFAVGDATAGAAREAGFAQVTAGDADVAALARLILSRPPDGTVLHPRATEPAGDLAGELARGGVAARSVPVYSTEPATALPEAALVRRPEAVLVHSPKAARTLARLVPPAAAATMTAYCLSLACAEPLRDAGFRRVETASAPNEAALLALIGR